MLIMKIMVWILRLNIGEALYSIILAFSNETYFKTWSSNSDLYVVFYFEKGGGGCELI